MRPTISVLNVTWHAACYRVPILFSCSGLSAGGPALHTTPRPSNHARPQQKGMIMEEVIDALQEVRRERLMRKSLYPRLISSGKLSQEEADRRLYCMAWAEAYLRKLVENWATVDQIINHHTPTTPTMTD